LLQSKTVQVKSNTQKIADEIDIELKKISDIENGLASVNAPVP